MHSRIFQVSTKPIEKDNYITESDYYDHWFLREIADYVVDSDREDDIDWISNGIEGIEFGNDENGEFFIVTDKHEYFKKTYNQFFDTLSSLNRIITLQSFSTDNNGYDSVGGHIYRLCTFYKSKFDFYVDNDDNLETLDEFVRGCELLTKYYIGGTMDYHY